MKYVILRSLLVTFAMATIMSSCNDINVEIEKENSIETFEPKGVPGEENNNETITVELSNATITTSGCINATNGMLEFADKDCYVQVYKAIVNHTDAVLAAWESSMGFTSLWSYYHALEADSTFNDWANDSLRCYDEYFERLLNSSNQLRIGDSTFTYNFPDSSITIYDHISGNSNTVDLDPVYGAYKTGWACDIQRVCTRSGTYKSPWRIKMSKVAKNDVNNGTSSGEPLDYSICKFTMKHYKKNTLGIWKKKVKTLNSKIPNGYEFRAERWSGTAGSWSPTQLSDIVYTNHEWKANNQSSFTWNLNPDGIPTKKNINYILFCVKKWERHTNAVDNDYNNVFNHDAW